MNINFNNINFGAKYVSTTQIKQYDYIKQNYSPVPASFVEIDPSNQSDREALHDLLKDWKGSDFTCSIVDSIDYESEDTNKVYALTRQSKDFNNLRSSEIVGLADMDITKGKTPELMYLQVDPILLQKMEPPVYKSVGTGIINSLKRVYNKAIQLVSLYSATEFY